MTLEDPCAAQQLDGSPTDHAWSFGGDLLVCAQCGVQRDARPNPWGPSIDYVDGVAVLPYVPAPALGHEGPWCPDCGYCTRCHARCKKTGGTHNG